MTVQKFLDENHDIKHLLLAENERVMETLCTALSGEKITEITLIAKGSTNRSYLVCTTQNSYVLRIPGIGSGEMVDRYREKEIYDLIKDYGIADEVVYLNPESGIKISVYCENARFLDLTKENEVKAFLNLVKKLHSLNLKCSFRYDFFTEIENFERLRNSASCFCDYENVKNDIFSLKDILENSSEKEKLIHNDLSSENCLFYKDKNGEEKCILIDFEYAAMQSPAADIAYFCVFSDLDETMTDSIIEKYYKEECTAENYREVYAYIAINAFFHTNWLEYKISLEDAKRGSRREESAKAYNMAKLYLKKFREVQKCQE